MCNFDFLLGYIWFSDMCSTAVLSGRESFSAIVRYNRFKRGSFEEYLERNEQDTAIVGKDRKNVFSKECNCRERRRGKG